METWKPITKEELEELIQRELGECSEEQKTLFKKYAVPLEHYEINRFGKNEKVYVAAVNKEEALYYEDVEEGWNFSPLKPVLDHWCNQDELKHALSNWTNK